MANRSMLFASSGIPDGTAKLELMGLAEFPYDVPVIYQLLVSTSPKLCRSCVFNLDEDLAIAGDAIAGLETLCKVRDELPDNAAALPAFNQAIEFLSQEHNKYPYYLLEPAEVFDMLDKPLSVQMAELFEAVSVLNFKQIEQRAKRYVHPEYWGTDSWNNILYYEPKGTVKAPPKPNKPVSKPGISKPNISKPAKSKPSESTSAKEPTQPTIELESSNMSGFEACVELVEKVFGEQARKLSLDGHQLEIRFFLNVLEIRSVEAVAEGSAYEFKQEKIHLKLCQLMSEALAKIVREKSIHELIFNLNKSGEWAHKVVVNKDQIVADQYAISVEELAEQRIGWFKEFIQHDEVRELNFPSSSGPRHLGPLWPAARFGYLLGHSNGSLWIMSHGLSNPVFHTNEPKWKQSNGVGCEVLVRCESQKLDLAVSSMEILESPELTTMIAICSTMVYAANHGEYCLTSQARYETNNDKFNRASKAQVVELEYYKHTLFKPIKAGKTFVLTNASLYKLCEKIPCLGRAKALPLIASAIPKNLEGKKPTAITQALIDSDTLGLLPKLKANRKSR